MAMRLFSASDRRARSSSTPSSSISALIIGQSQAGEQPLAVAHVAHHEPGGRGFVLDQGRDGDDAVFHYPAGHLVDVDDLQFVLAREMFLADGTYRGDGPYRARCHSRDVQPKHIFFGCDQALARRGRKSRPTSTRSVLERSPMIFLIGVGSLRTSVGSARIWSPLPSAGFSTRSITSML